MKSSDLWNSTNFTENLVKTNFRGDLAKCLQFTFNFWNSFHKFSNICEIWNCIKTAFNILLFKTQTSATKRSTFYNWICSILLPTMEESPEGVWSWFLSVDLWLQLHPPFTHSNQIRSSVRMCVVECQKEMCYGNNSRVAFYRVILSESSCQSSHNRKLKNTEKYSQIPISHTDTIENRHIKNHSWTTCPPHDSRKKLNNKQHRLQMNNQFCFNEWLSLPHDSFHTRKKCLRCIEVHHFTFYGLRKLLGVGRMCIGGIPAGCAAKQTWECENFTRVSEKAGCERILPMITSQVSTNGFMNCQWLMKKFSPTNFQFKSNRVE